MAGIFLRDSSEYMSDIDHCIMQIRQWHLNGALKIPKSSILGAQLAQIGLYEIKEIDQRFHAIAALMRLLMSFEAYPWRRQGHDEGVSITNIGDRGKTKTSDTYQEFYTG